MSSQQSFTNIDPVELLHEHYDAVEMREEYRRELQHKSRGTIAARRWRSRLRWAFCLAGMAAAVLIVVLLLSPVSWYSTTLGVKATASSMPPPQFRAALHIAPPPASIDSSAAQPPLPKAVAPPSAPPVPSRRDNLGKAPSISTVDLENRIEPQSPASIPPSASPGIATAATVISLTQPATQGAGLALVVGDQIRMGDIIHTGQGGQLVLSTCIGSELIMAANSRLSITANNTAMITGGRLFCRAKEIAVIDTPSGKIALRGATVNVAVSPKNTVVIVVAGGVRLSNAHGSTLVLARKRAIMPASRAPQPGAPVNIERETSWHYSLGKAPPASGTGQPGFLATVISLTQPATWGAGHALAIDDHIGKDNIIRTLPGGRTRAQHVHRQ